MTLVKGQFVIPIGLCSAKEKISVRRSTDTTTFIGDILVLPHRVELGLILSILSIEGKKLQKLPHLHTSTTSTQPRGPEYNEEKKKKDLQ